MRTLIFILFSITTLASKNPLISEQKDDMPAGNGQRRTPSAENSRMKNQNINHEYDFSVITLGTGTPEYSASKSNASTAIQYNGSYYIIDCGDGSYANMEASDFRFQNVRAILLTHHHIDHTTDFFDIYTKCLLSGSDGLQIIGPPRTRYFADFANDVYLDDFLYRISNTRNSFERADKERLTGFAEVKEIMGEEIFELDTMQITTAEMTHTMYNLAYRFDADGKSIVVSGDTSYDDDLVRLAEGADILVIDGSLYMRRERDEKEREQIEPFYEYGGNFEVDPHLSFDNMVRIARDADVKTLVITHYGEAEEIRIQNSIDRIGETFDGEVIYASDMQEIGIER